MSYFVLSVTGKVYSVAYHTTVWNCNYTFFVILNALLFLRSKYPHDTCISHSDLHTFRILVKTNSGKSLFDTRVPARNLHANQRSPQQRAKTPLVFWLHWPNPCHLHSAMIDPTYPLVNHILSTMEICWLLPECQKSRGHHGNARVSIGRNQDHDLWSQIATSSQWIWRKANVKTRKSFTGRPLRVF